MKIYGPDDIDLVKSRDRTYPLDPITLEFTGLSAEELTWHQVMADGPNANMFDIAQWLTSVNITEWCWRDRAVDRMVHRNTLYFKHERDATMFSLWWSCKIL